MPKRTDPLAAEFGPEDGLDPRRFHDRRRQTQTFGPRTPGRKALQLCGQVKDTLPGLLAGFADEVLQALTVVTVDPAPHAGRLMVTVAVPVPATPEDRATAERHLARAASRLRSEVAAGVHRKRAPELAFRVV